MIGLFELMIIGVTILLAFTLWWYLSGPTNLPPGPLGLPLFGSSLKTWRSSTLCDQLCQWAKKYGPVYKLYVGNKMVVVLSDWNTIQEGLVKQGDTYAGRPHFNTIFPDEIVGVGKLILHSDTNLRNFKLISYFRINKFWRRTVENSTPFRLEYIAFFRFRSPDPGATYSRRSSIFVRRNR